MTKDFQGFSYSVIDQYIQGVDLGKKTQINKVLVGGIYISENVEIAQHELGQKVDKILTNSGEGIEPIKTPLNNYIFFDTKWWRKTKKNYGIITKTIISIDLKSYQIEYRNGKKK